MEEPRTDAQLKRFQLLSVILAVALVLALVAVGLLVKAKGDATSERDDAKERLGRFDAADAAARELLVDITTYDYKHLDGTYDWLDRLTSSEVKKNFVDRRKDFEKVIRLSKASSEGEVEDSAYRPGPDDDSVVVIAFVHQTITEDVDHSRKTEDQWATLTMVPGDSASEWLAKDIQLSGVPNPDGTVTQQ